MTGCRRTLTGIAATIGLISGAGSAEPASPCVATPAPLVVELFTSQGCPKCPAADRLIAEFARMPGVIALSLPVAIWDFIGWKDTLAEPAFARRQAAYAAARGDRLVFTPQAVVDGLSAEPGANREAILGGSRCHHDRGQAPAVSISLEEAGGHLRIAVAASRDDARMDAGKGDIRPDAAGVYVFRVARAKTVAIPRGENSGRTVTYTNVVRAMSRIGDWTGKEVRFDLFELKAEDEGYVVLVQTGPPDRPGAILAAAKTSDL